MWVEGDKALAVAACTSSDNQTHGSFAAATGERPPPLSPAHHLGQHTCSYIYEEENNMYEVKTTCLLHGCTRWLASVWAAAAPSHQHTPAAAAHHPAYARPPCISRCPRVPNRSGGSAAARQDAWLEVRLCVTVRGSCLGALGMRSKRTSVTLPNAGSPT